MPPGNPLATRAILAPYLDNGRVDYAALAGGLDVDSLCAGIASRDLSRAGRDEQLAFYLNAYNLLVIRQVLARLEADPAWPGPVSVADKLRFFLGARHVVAGRAMSLMTLENRVIRRRFRDARVHFALNCASSSCPWLPGQLFVAEHLEDDLERLTAQFLASDAVTYKPETRTLSVSPIFRWYRRDFRPSIAAFIARYREVPADARVTFQAYDWRLNRG
jgi:hypothetical protein